MPLKLHNQEIKNHIARNPHIKAVVDHLSIGQRSYMMRTATNWLEEDRSLHVEEALLLAYDHMILTYAGC